MLNWLILLLVVQQTLSYPAHSMPDNNVSVVQSDDSKPFVSTDDKVVDPTTPEIEQPDDSSSTEPRGFWSNLFSQSSPTESPKPDTPGAGGQAPNKTGAESGTPNKVGTGSQRHKPPHKQSATIISQTTYPEGAKPTKPDRPGQGKPPGSTSQNHTSTPPSDTSPPVYPPESPLFDPSLFVSPVAVGSQKPLKPPGKPHKPPGKPQKPVKPPVSPGPGSSLLGPSLFGGSFPGSLQTFPSFSGFMLPPQSGFLADMPPFHPPQPIAFGSPFGGFGHPFGGLGSPYGSQSFMQKPKPPMFSQGHANGYDLAIPSWMFP